MEKSAPEPFPSSLSGGDFSSTLHSHQAQRLQTALIVAQAALGVGSIARELLVSLVHPVMLPGGDGWREVL